MMMKLLMLCLFFSHAMLHLDDLPTMEELETALSWLKVRKAGGLSGIPLEMILCGDPVLRNR